MADSADSEQHGTDITKKILAGIFICTLGGIVLFNLTRPVNREDEKRLADYNHVRDARVAAKEKFAITSKTYERVTVGIFNNELDQDDIDEWRGEVYEEYNQAMHGLIRNFDSKDYDVLRTRVDKIHKHLSDFLNDANRDDEDYLQTWDAYLNTIRGLNRTILEKAEDDIKNAKLDTQ